MASPQERMDKQTEQQTDEMSQHEDQVSSPEAHASRRVPEGTVTEPSSVLERGDEPVATRDDSTITGPGDVLPRP